MSDIALITQNLSNELYEHVLRFLERNVVSMPSSESLIDACADVVALVLEADHQARLDSWCIDQRKHWNSVISDIKDLDRGIKSSNSKENARLIGDAELGDWCAQLAFLAQRVPQFAFQGRFTFWDPFQDPDKSKSNKLRENLLLSAAMGIFADKLGLARSFFESLLGQLAADERLRMIGYSLQVKTADQIDRSCNSIRHNLANGGAVIWSNERFDLMIVEMKRFEFREDDRTESIVAAEAGAPLVSFVFYGQKDKLMQILRSHLKTVRY